MAAGQTGLGMASSVFQFGAQKRAAEARHEFEVNRYKEVARNARESYDRSLSILSRRGAQRAAVAGQQSLQNEIARLRGKASANAQGSAAGIDNGRTMDALYADFERRSAENRLSIRTNLEQGLRDDLDRAEEIHAQNQSRINSATPTPVSGPSPLALALQLGGNVMGGFQSYWNMGGRFNDDDVVT